MGLPVVSSDVVYMEFFPRPIGAFTLGTIKSSCLKEQNNSAHTKSPYVSVNSKPDHPGQPNGEFFKRANSHPSGYKESVKPRPLAQKDCAKTLHPWGNYFQKFSKNTKHEIEIMKNSTEMLTCLEILKQ